MFTVNVIEEKPIGVFLNEGNEVLFSENLKKLEILAKNQNNFENLIRFIGQDSIKKSINLLKNLDFKLQQTIKNAELVNRRRWNLLLDNGILLKLSENNIAESMDKFDKIFISLSEDELGIIESIDLRVNHKAIIKYKSIIND